ncbi:MAG: BREX-3 system P-loop-containing protein BrxF [Thermodesulfobacteriota bacterium]|nr:BREX-3 system P-loop-containing protein BrxF [Thermodesulfobacteriota bacterium]
MPMTIPDQIINKVDEVKNLYERLILIVSPSGSGKTSALQEVSSRTGAPIVNVNLELSKCLLDLGQKKRQLKLPTLLDDIIRKREDTLLLLDNIELLFDTNLKLKPLSLLQTVSRNKTLVVSWNGHIANDRLLYAEPGHHEYRECDIKGLQLISPDL